MLRRAKVYPTSRRSVACCHDYHYAFEISCAMLPLATRQAALAPLCESSLWELQICNRANVHFRLRCGRRSQMRGSAPVMVRIESGTRWHYGSSTSELTPWAWAPVRVSLPPLKRSQSPPELRKGSGRESTKMTSHHNMVSVTHPADHSADRSSQYDMCNLQNNILEIVNYFHDWNRVPVFSWGRLHNCACVGCLHFGCFDQ